MIYAALSSDIVAPLNYDIFVDIAYFLFRGRGGKGKFSPRRRKYFVHVIYQARIQEFTLGGGGGAWERR